MQVEHISFFPKSYSVQTKSKDCMCVTVCLCIFFLLVTERSPASQSNTESDSSELSPNAPTILVTAPSRDNIYGSPSTLTIADAVKERRPSSMPFIVGKKLVGTQWLQMLC